MSIRTQSHVLLVWLLTLSAAASAVENLLVNRVEQQVDFREVDGGTWKPLISGSRITPPVEVRTGPQAGALLSQGESFYTMKASTHLGFELSDSRSDGLISKIRQWVGTAFYKIERQSDTFSVETPFIVSTVKGTHFVIVTTDADSFVTLTEGSLEILDIDTGERRLIAPGEIAGSSAGGSASKTYAKPAAAASASSSVSWASVTATTEQSGRIAAGSNSGSTATRDSPDNTIRTEAAFERALKGIDQVQAEVRGSRQEKTEARPGRVEIKERIEARDDSATNGDPGVNNPKEDQPHKDTPKSDEPKKDQPKEDKDTDDRHDDDDDDDD